MKKIIYLITTLVLAFSLSSFIYPTSKEKIKIGKDSTQLNININSKVQNVGPYKFEPGDKLIEACQSIIDVNKLKTIVLENLSKKPIIEEKYLPTTQQVILNEYKLGNNEFIIHRIRNDIIIKFISIGLILTLLIILLRNIIKWKEDWKLLLVKGFLIFISIIISYPCIYYILSCIFNNKFLTMKELINLLI